MAKHLVALKIGDKIGDTIKGFSDFEVIFVDDGSTDETGKLVKDYIENCFEKMEENKKASIQFDFNPMSGF